MAGVILAIAMATAGFFFFANRLQAQELVQESGRKAPDPGPRAVGLVELSSKGKARLIPIAIMLDGKFFDAGAYKATPVPMALDFGVIYEGFKTGVSQGLFTITQPGQLNHNWIAEGTWLPDGAKMQTNTKKYAPPVIDDDDSGSGRPVLHRRKEGAADKDESKSSSPTSTTASNSPPASPNSTGSSPSTSSPTTTSPSPSSTSTSPSGSPSGGSTSSGAANSGSASGNSASASKGNDSSKPATSRPSASDEEPISDPNRPILRRGKPDPNAHHEPYVNFDDAAGTTQAAAGAKTASAKGAAPAGDANVYQVFPAISDAKGPDARPYTYDLKPAEEAIYRNKMLELAATLIKTNGRPTPPASSTGKKSAGNAAVKPRDQFEEVHLRAFDLSYSNEPTLVLSARTPVPPAGAPAGQVPKEITLVARTDLEGELQKLFFAQTDSRHLDVSPRMELIDAVDADGDGRGELLFRQTSDAGSGYAIYRVAADKIWPLYESTP